MTKWIIIAVLTAFIYYLLDTPEVSYTSKHFYDGRFHNAVERQRSFLSVMPKGLKVLFGSENLRPKTSPPVLKLTKDYIQSDTAGELEVTWISHANVLIKYNDVKILTDPVFSKRASFSKYIGPERFEDTYPLEDVDTGPIDVVIISHNHYDHLDRKAVEALKDRTGMFVVSLGVGQYLRKWGVDPLRIVELDWDDSYMMRDIVITAAPASHMSKRTFFDRNKTFWSSFVIRTGSKSVYFSADTGYIKDFEALGRKYGRFDIALLDIGAYNKAWPENHMTPEQAVQAGIDINAGLVLPIHWGTFQLSDFKWTEPIERFTAEAKLRKVPFATPVQGETVIPGSVEPENVWWQNVK